MKKILYLVYLAIPSMCAAQQVITSETLHLRDGLQQEWSSFPVHAKDSQLVIHFKTDNVSRANTIAITQTDVNHVWSITLNGKILGNLEPDEKKMVSYYFVPPATLIENGNTLIIRSESENTSQADDIFVGQILLFDKDRDSLLSESSLNIHSGIPSRLTILNENNSLQPVKAIAADTLAVRSGVVYSGTGNFSFSLPAGKYRIYASRGFEYGVDSQLVHIHAGEKLFRKVRLQHEIDLKGWKSVDTHVHTFEFSGHGDASMKERILTIAGEGLDYAVITEHNKVVDITGMVKEMNLDKWFTPIRGDELTTRVGHFNMFPTSSAPSPEVKNWHEVKEVISKNHEAKVVILNHARDVHNGFRPLDSMQYLSDQDFPANAMEVINSGSQQTNPRQLYLDWLGLITKGIVLTPVGSSDSHDVSRFIVGQARTYVRNGDLVNNFAAGKVGVSFGLFTEMKVDQGNKRSVMVTVHAPSWIKPQRLRLFADGIEIYSSFLSARDKIRNNVFARKINLPVFSKETVLVAVAEGPDPGVPWWPIAKPYQHESPDVSPIVLGLTGPVRISP